MKMQDSLNETNSAVKLLNEKNDDLLRRLNALEEKNKTKKRLVVPNDIKVNSPITFAICSIPMAHELLIKNF